MSNNDDIDFNKTEELVKAIRILFELMMEKTPNLKCFGHAINPKICYNSKNDDKNCGGQTREECQKLFELIHSDKKCDHRW